MFKFFALCLLAVFAMAAAQANIFGYYPYNSGYAANYASPYAYSAYSTYPYSSPYVANPYTAAYSAYTAYPYAASYYSYLRK